MPVKKHEVVTNLVGRSAVVNPDFAHIVPNEMLEMTMEIVAARLHEDRSGIVLTVRLPDGQMRDAATVWLLVEGE